MSPSGRNNRNGWRWWLGRELYEVRVREQVGPNRWTKKSRFYWAGDSRDAKCMYKGTGKIMWVQRTSREKLLGIGEFFTMGNRLLKEFAQQEKDSTGLLNEMHLEEKEKTRKKRFFLLKEKRGIA